MGKVWCFICYCVLIANVYGLNCRTDGGPKEKELKSIYMRCLKKQDEKQSNDTRGSSREYREDRWSNQRGNNRDDRHGNSQGLNSRDERFESRHNPFDNREYGFGSRGDNFGSNSDYNRRNDYSNNNNYSGKTEFGSRNDYNRNNDDDMQNKYGQDDWTESHRSWSRGRGNGQDDLRRDMMNNMGRKRSNGMDNRDDYTHNSDSGMTRYNEYSQSSLPSRRYKREKTNSGHRSQYNPNSRRMDSLDFRKDDSNSTNNNSSRPSEDSKACALHCFVEELEMTGDNGMPDRHLVTRVITKDVRDEDLREFLQESVEDCFQILFNEHTDDKCEFSRDLMTCLSEKGRANCDDWKEDMRFSMHQH